MSATSHDFKTWEADASKCSTEQLKNIIQDCKDAEIAMRSFNTLYQEENQIMQYLTKQELMLINQEWQEEYEQKDIRL